ncbi:RNA polymerase sigma-70 factor, ECF subfamily [Chitinophaga costaii]|uniref:RNA polymerase sigma-70 factor, ECF subfamily n=1 Tax=Chitinophaga costaii TaxID=1335309 RepID=A0A1C3YPZ8_9BACT|nr:RNA polymerase sigma-70 factor [Chitinophaga costaii]PUZ30050.1 RNA polymerase sigma-70 factor [Chitinophaga costaii]SCB72164.1 RNA polymerase sigma-70 factor, ECF subfamily [Chitinophaga costaii]
MSQKSSFTEHQLLQGISSGDTLHYAYIFQEYYSALCHYAETIIGEPGHAEDMVQDVFEKLWQRPYAFEDLRHVKDFLYKATRNAALNFLKGAQHSLERQAKFLQEQEKAVSAEALDVIRMEVFRSIYREISNLPEQCGKIVRMSYMDGLKNEQIAEMLSISLQTVKNQKTRGMKLLRARLSTVVFSLFLLFSQQP